MSNPVPDESATAEEALDPSVARAERRLRWLEELAEIGMELARALRPRADADETPDKTTGKDPATAFAPLSRAIRLTLALEARTDEDLRNLKAGIVVAREAAWAPLPEPVRKDRVERVRGLVLAVVDAEAEDPDEYGELYEALDERLEEDEAYFNLARRPVRETVERLCKDLTLTPDWSRWQGEGWIDDGARPLYSPFRQPSRKPLLDEDGEPLATPAPCQSLHALE
jgi:hypothetical protein